MKESVETTFNKDLFLSLCQKHNVTLSKTATEPMIIIEKVGKNMKTRKRKYKIKFRRAYAINFDFEKMMIALRELMSEFNFDILSIKLRDDRLGGKSYIKIKCEEQLAATICMKIFQKINPWIDEISF